MIKRIVLVYKRDEMSGEEFRKYYIAHHGPIVAQMPGLLYYRQNPTLPDSDGNEQEISGIAEIWYENDAALHHAMSSPQAAAANASLANFVDVSRTKIIPVEEYIIL